MAKNENQTPSQAAFAVCWKSDLKNASNPLMQIELSGQELKFMDVRPNHDEEVGEISPETGRLNYEMFWSGEADELDTEAFLTRVTDILKEYGGEVTGKMREAGCMISMVAVPFTISEDDAMKLGKAMFDDFGQIVDSDDEKEEKTQMVASSAHADNTGVDIAQ